MIEGRKRIWKSGKNDIKIAGILQKKYIQYIYFFLSEAHGQFRLYKYWLGEGGQNIFLSIAQIGG